MSVEEVDETLGHITDLKNFPEGQNNNDSSNDRVKEFDTFADGIAHNLPGGNHHQQNVHEHRTPLKQQIDYDRLRNQCLSAMSELETLRRQHAEIMNRCECSAQEANYFKKQNKELIASSDKANEEYETLREKYEREVADKSKIKQDYEEIVLLREQEKLEPGTKPRSVEGKALAVYNSLQKENEDLKYNFDDLNADHDLLQSKFKQVEEERLKSLEQFEQLREDYSSLTIERNALKQQCTAAIRGYEKALHDRDEAVREALYHKERRNTTVVELEQAVKVKLQMSKDILKLREERNSALHEYKLVMSERDTVHQEIERLQHDLGITKDEAKKLVDDKEKVFLEKEGLRHEIIAVLADRDKAFKEVHDLRSRLNVAIKEKEQAVKQLEEQRQGFEMLKQERNAAQKERGEAIVHRDRILKECFEVKSIMKLIEKGEGNAESLQQPFEKLSNELTKAWNTAEMSMTRRDWAFSVRDKVVRELEEYKEKYENCIAEKSALELNLTKYQTECDLLQKRFDKMTSQRNTIRKSIAFADIAVPSEREEGANLRSSHDSAIGTEAPSYHIETVELKKVGRGFGFEIGGGQDTPLSPHDTSVFIVSVQPGSPAHQKIKVKDCIICVNNSDMTSVTYQTAYDAIHSNDTINITILRHTRMGSKTPLQRVELKSGDENVGLSIDSGLHIKHIEPGSAAAKEETLSIGDKILSVNGYSMDNVPYDEAMSLLKTSNLSLTVLKPSVSSTSSHRSLAQNTDDAKDTKTSGSASVGTISSSIASLLTNRRRSSVLTEEEELQKILANMEKVDEQKSPQRTSSFISALQSDGLSSRSGAPMSTEQVVVNLRSRPTSAQGGSKQSMGSGSSVNRFSYDFGRATSPLNTAAFSRTDPLAFSAKPQDAMTLPSRHLTPSSIAANSTRAYNATKRRRPFTVTSQYLPNIQTSRLHTHRALSEIFANQPQNPLPAPEQAAISASSEHFGTFPGKYTRLDLLQSSSKSSRSFGYKSGSSYGSLNSSEFSSEKATSPNVGNLISEPVHEETVESLKELMSAARTNTPQRLSSSAANGDEDPRLIVIEKGQYPLGITIAQGESNGIFVTGVNKESIASKAGLKYGDQLLEYNGINLRMASYEQAEWVLKQSAVESTVTVRMQYCPDRIKEIRAPVIEEPLSTPTTTTHTPPLHPSSSPHVTVKCTSPFTSPSLRLPQLRGNAAAQSHRRHSSQTSASVFRHNSSSSASTALRHNSNPSSVVSRRHNSNASSSSTHSHKTIQADLFCAIHEDANTPPVGEARMVRLERRPSSTPIGIGITGGNALGIFISDITPDSLAAKQPGLKCRDQILEYNGKSLANSTLEDATLELYKPTEVADFLVKYNSPGYTKAQSEPGENFHIKTMYDRVSSHKGELSFKRGDILLVTNTLYKGQLGVWRACLLEMNPNTLHDDNYKPTKGRIPSKGKAEQELLLRRTSSYSNHEDKLKGRKSLFRRSKKNSHGHSVNHSRESSDSRGDVDSNVSSLSLPPFPALDLGAYVYVKRYDTTFPRPVVVVGAMAEPICDKLVVETAATFSRCLPEINDISREEVETRLHDGTYIDYKTSRKSTRLECVTPQSIKDVVYGKSKHCLLDINPEAIERLPLKLYPVVIFIKYKSAKQIKDLRDGHYIRDKMASKSAKELFEYNSKIEKENSKNFTATITCSSLINVCKEIEQCVAEEQNKTLWVSVE